MRPIRPLLFLFSLGALLWALPAAAQAPAAGADEAAEAEDDMDDLLSEIEAEFEESEESEGWAAPAEEAMTYPRLEHHGYFRFRPDLMWRLHLATHARVDGQTIGTSGVRPPITENVINNASPLFGEDEVGTQGDNELAGANIRFRYTPTFHIARELRVTAQFDILDNLVLGSTPDFHPERPDAPLSAFAGSQQSPTAGINSARDAVTVRQVYGEWLSPFGLLRVGRQSSHWGLGILANNGEHFDADFGDYVDRALLLTRLPIVDLYLAAAWDYVATGRLSDNQAQFFGQPYDLGEADDVQEFVVAIFDKSLSPREQARRHHRLHVQREPVFEWGAYYVYRSQDLTAPGELEPTFTTSYDLTELVVRDAVAHIPDLWFRLDWAPAPGQHLHIEAEGVMIIGKLGNVFDGDALRDGERDLLMAGGALQADWTAVDNRLTIGLDTGAASGDEAEFFGVLDQKNFAEGTQVNKNITNFKFDRSFQVDHILFREVIGTVTNAFYFKPWVQWDFFESKQVDLGGRLDLQYARALKAAATPGNDPNLGLELDFTLFYEELGVFRVDMVTAFFFPGAAFDLVGEDKAGSGNGFLGAETSKDAKMAIRLKGRFIWMF